MDAVRSVCEMVRFVWAWLDKCFMWVWLEWVWFEDCLFGCDLSRCALDSVLIKGDFWSLCVGVEL